MVLAQFPFDMIREREKRSFPHTLSLDKQRIAARFLLEGEHREGGVRRVTGERPSQSFAGVTLVELLAVTIGDEIFFAEEPEQRTFLEAARHFHNVTHLVTVESAAGSHDDGVVATFLQFVSEEGLAF
jgi:hypothetical protein